MNKIFYKCLGFNTKIKFNKPIFFYHVPKCAGTTLAVLISHLFQKTQRLNGPLFKNNDKGGSTAYENFLKSENLINSSQLQYLYGHLPFEIHNKLKNKYLFLTIVREPVQRCVSHYAWAISRRFCSITEDINDLFENNKIPQNAIVNQFSGIGLSNPNSDESINLALHNLLNKIDILIDVEDLFKLLNLIISSYDLPNLFFQSQQVNYNKIKISEETIEKIKKHNRNDIILYSKLLKRNLIKNYSIKNFEERNTNIYLYSSPELLVNKKKTLLLSEHKIKAIEMKLIESNYKIQIV